MSVKWKLGDEFKLFHPRASHVGPDYRDGWNTCFLIAEVEVEKLRARQAVLVELLAMARNYLEGLEIADEIDAALARGEG